MKWSYANVELTGNERAKINEVINDLAFASKTVNRAIGALRHQGPNVPTEAHKTLARADRDLAKIGAYLAALRNGKGDK